MRFYIEDQVTGLIDGYYHSELMANAVCEGLNSMPTNHLFSVRNSEDRKNRPIQDSEFLGSHEWFLEMVVEHCDWDRQ